MRHQPVYRLAILALSFSIHAAHPADVPPSISIQPLSQAVNPGSNVTFTVTASGTAPLRFQWRINGAELPGNTNATVTLTNLQPHQAGGYSVVVTNDAGTVTSQVARLQIVSGFTFVTNSPLGQTIGNPIGAAWADCNHDGWVDLFADSFQGGRGYLFLTNNGGSYRPVPNSIFGSDQGGRTGAAWADYDNDGWFDLAICAASGPRIFVYHGETNGTFTLQTNSVFLTSNLQTFSCAWGDYDNDGFVDLFITTSTAGFSGANDLLFHNNRDGTFTRVTNAAPTLDNAVGQSGVWGDYDNDGRLDLFVASLGGGRNLLYHNEGNGSFTKRTNIPVVSDGGNSGGAVWGDFDNDGDLDLFVTNFSAQNAYLYRNDGSGVFVRLTNSVVVQDGGSAGCIALDFDNDGWLDLVSPAGRNLLYHNNGDGTFTKVTSDAVVAQTYSTSGNNSFTTADVDHDGYQDLLLVNFGARNQLFLNRGGSNRWLTLHLEGRVSNRAAIGAKVRLRAVIGGNEFWQMREISGGGNYFAQNELSAAFGLGDASQADTVRVEWPSGIVQEFANVAAGQILKIREPARGESITPPSDTQFQFALRGGKRIVYEIESSTNLLDWLPFRTVTNLAATVMVVDTNRSLAPAKFYRVVER